MPERRTGAELECRTERSVGTVCPTKKKMRTFQPNYQNVVDAAYNRAAKRLPLYEHNVDAGKIGEIIGKDFAGLYEGNERIWKNIFPITVDFSVTMDMMWSLLKGASEKSCLAAEHWETAASYR